MKAEMSVLLDQLPREDVDRLAAEVRQLRPRGTSRLNKALEDANLVDLRLDSLKVLALTLVQEIDSLERQVAGDSLRQLDFQSEVRRFEAALIRSALKRTGGRQRAAARLLRMNAATLNSKIKRYRINSVEDQSKDGKYDLGVAERSSVEDSPHRRSREG